MRQGLFPCRGGSLLCCGLAALSCEPFAHDLIDLLLGKELFPRFRLGGVGGLRFVDISIFHIGVPFRLYRCRKRICTAVGFHIGTGKRSPPETACKGDAPEAAPMHKKTGPKKR